jgi:hypothetical protein
MGPNVLAQLLTPNPALLRKEGSFFSFSFFTLFAKAERVE